MLLFNLLSFSAAMGWVSHSAALWFALPTLQFYGFSFFRRLPFASLSFAWGSSLLSRPLAVILAFTFSRFNKCAHLYQKKKIYLECRDCHRGLLQIEVMMESFLVYATVCVINSDDSPNLCSI